jgi:hypothetical protein
MGLKRKDRVSGIANPIEFLPSRNKALGSIPAPQKEDIFVSLCLWLNSQLYRSLLNYFMTL